MDWGRTIDRMVTGYRDAMTLVHASKAGIFESLGAGPRTAAEIAAACGLDERATGVVVRSLAAAGLLEKSGDGFTLAPGAAPYLLAGGPQSMTSIIGHNRSLMRNWLRLDEVLRSGEPVEHGGRTAEELRDFICGMADISRHSSREVAARIDLSGASRLLDLGGGPGSAAIAFCRANPRLRCVLFDLPEAAAIGAEQVAAAGLQDRISVQAGDFLVDDLGTAFDVVYVSNIIHMLDPDETRRLLTASRAALVPGGRILIKDFFLEDDLITPAWAAQFSVNMLVGTSGGKAYARSEAFALLREAGFGGGQTVDIGEHSQVLVADRES